MHKCTFVSMLFGCILCHERIHKIIDFIYREYFFVMEFEMEKIIFTIFNEHDFANFQVDRTNNQKNTAYFIEK